jgi:hypothetical protein
VVIVMGVGDIADGAAVDVGIVTTEGRVATLTTVVAGLDWGESKLLSLSKRS